MLMNKKPLIVLALLAAVLCIFSGCAGIGTTVVQVRFVDKDGNDLTFSSVGAQSVSQTGPVAQTDENVQTQPIPVDTPTVASDKTTTEQQLSGSDTTAPQPTEPLAPAPQTTEPVAASSGEMTKKQIAELFNTAANKVKTEATIVTKNYSDTKNLEEYMQMPSALQAIASPLMNTFMKRNDTPETFSGADAILAEFPVSGEAWSAKVTEDDLLSASCDDDGSCYNVRLVFNESENCAVGSGVGTAFNIISTDSVKERVSVIESFSARYPDCEINAKIEKSTGRLIWGNYKRISILSIKAKVLVTLDAQIGLSSEVDYSISY